MIDTLRSCGIHSVKMCEMFLIKVCGLYILLQNNPQLLSDFLVLSWLNSQHEKAMISTHSGNIFWPSSY